MTKGQAILVTTKYRGVFFGYAQKWADLPGEITLTKARNCIYWDAACEGFIGLSTAGPNDKCRIGPRAKVLTLYGITSHMPVSDDAVAAWERATWK